MSPFAPLLNYALYQAGWLALVLGAARDRVGAGSAVALVLLAVHFLLADDRAAERRLVILGGALGTTIDSLLIAAGLVRFPAGQIVPWLCPVWIAIMWMQFATLFRGALGWLTRRLVLGSLLGAAGGPAAYAAGEALSAVTIVRPWGLVVLAVVWAGVIPLFLAAAARQGIPHAIYRIDRQAR